jgi:LuxR family transcriptional regulator, maltose regulon positive regulatory protein
MPLGNQFATTAPRPRNPERLRFELTRQALLEKLERDDGFSVVALTAPAGYGKTTFLGQFIRQSNRPTAWLELAPDDSSFAHLAISLQHTIQREVPNADFKHFETMLERQQQAENSDIESLARAFAHDLDSLEVNLNIVIDETERLSAESGRWVSMLAKHLTEGHRLFLSGYDLTHLSLSRQIAKGTAFLIEQHDLRFSLEEAHTYFESRQFTGEIQIAYNACDGWAAGLALIAAGASPSFAPETLIEEALEQLPTALQNALPEAAVLEIWSSAQVRDLGCELPEDWLRVLQRSGLPMTPLGNETFKPHHLLREVLEQQLQQQPVRHAELHIRAGNLASQSDDLIRAFEHYLAAQAEAASRFTAERIVGRFRIAGEHHLIRHTLECLPLNWLDLELEIALCIAWIMTGETQKGETRLRQLHAQGQANAAALGALARLAQRQGNAAEELALAEEALGMGGPPLEMSLCRRLRGFALIGLQRAKEALEIAEQEIIKARKDRDDHTLAMALGLAHRAHYVLGDRTACIRILKECIDLYQALETPKQTLSFRNDIADLLRLEGRFIEAFSELEHAFAIQGEEETQERPFMLETKADLHYWSGNSSQAKLEYERALQLANKFHLRKLELRIQLKLIELNALQDTAKSDQMQLQLNSLTHDTSSITLQDLFFTQGIVAFVQGQIDQAETYFLKVNSSDDPSQYARSKAYLAQIALQQKRFMKQHAQAWLTALDRLGHDYVINLDIESTRPAILHALKQDWLSQSRFGHYCLADSITAPTATWQPQRFRLQITTLGSRRVQLEDQWLDVPLAKSFELLVRLALYGPATRSALITALWDGSLETRHTEYFKVAVRRLRANLELHPAIDFNPLPFEDQYMLSDQLDVVLDTQLLEHAIETKNKPELERLLQRRPGEFLKGIESEWVIEKRRHTVNDIVEGYTLLGELSTDQLAQQAFKHGLDIEPFNERCLIGLIEYYLKRGETHNANRTYQRYTQQLFEDTQLEPSLELKTALSTIGFTSSSPSIPRT